MSRLILPVLCAFGFTGAAMYQASRTDLAGPTVRIASTQDQDEAKEIAELAEKDVPAAVKKAASELAGDGRKLTFSKEEEWGATVYAAVWTIGEVAHEVVLAADGSLIETENETGLDALPAAVQAQVAKSFPKDAKLTIEVKVITVYEVETAIDGSEKTMLFAATGSPVEIVVGDEVAGEDEGDDDGDEEKEGDDDDDGKTGRKSGKKPDKKAGGSDDDGNSGNRFE